MPRHLKPKRYKAMFKLATDWRCTLKRAWSVRFLALAIFFIVAEALLPLFIDDMPRYLFVVLTAVSVVGALWARLVPQNDFK